MVSTTGIDGAGHRLEADISCIAAAHHVGLEYVVNPLRTMDHLPLAEGLRSFKHYRWFRWATPNMTIIHPEWLGIWENVTCLERRDWLTRLAVGKDSCINNGTALYIVFDCWTQFWCYTLFTPAWHSIQASLQRMYLRGVQPVVWFDPGDINVVVHCRQNDAGLRRLNMSWYWAVVAGLRRRHAEYRRRTPQGALGLRFWVHSDGPEIEELEWEQPPGRDRVRVFSKGEVALRQAIDQMLLADLLVMAVSSLSNFLALVGNMTAVVPLCAGRPRIDRIHNWYPVDCGDPGDLAAAPWP
eukprot:EG_transcript_21409